MSSDSRNSDSRSEHLPTEPGGSRYKIVLCHRRRKHLSRKDFHSHFEKSRSRLMLRLESQLRFEDYHRCFQARRYNPLYLGILASRSWLVTSLFTLLAGLGLRPGPDSKVSREERWDVVEELSYPSREALVEVLNSTGGRDAAQRLADDHRSQSRRTAVLVAESFPVIADKPSFPRTTTLFFLRSPRGLSRTKMLDYWGTSHKKLFVALRKRLEYIGYDQMHVRDGADLTRVIEAFGGSVDEEFDGVAKVVYRNQRVVLQGILNPSTQIANVRLLRDEITFIDAARSSLVFGRENRLGDDR